MDDSEKKVLAEALGQEPDEKVNVDVDGTVQPEASAEPTDKVDVADIRAQLTAAKQSLMQHEEFANNVYSYTELVDPKDESQGRQWNIKKIVEELGYDFNSLQKKNAKSEVEKETSTEITSDMVEKFKENPKAVIADILKQAKEQAIETAQAEIKPLQEDAKRNAAKVMLESCRTKHNDFAQYEDKIGSLLKKFPVDSAEDLEGLYYMAKGMEGAKPASPTTPNLMATTKGSGEVAEEKDEADAIFEKIQRAGVKPGKDDTTNQLFGKDRLSPIG